MRSVAELYQASQEDEQVRLEVWADFEKRFVAISTARPGTDWFQCKAVIDLDKAIEAAIAILQFVVATVPDSVTDEERALCERAEAEWFAKADLLSSHVGID